MLLFNFQGPLFLRSRFERSCSISHLFRKVNTFFQIFSEFFKIFLNISRNTIYRYINLKKTQEEGLAPFFQKKNLFKISKIRGKTADFCKKIFEKVFLFFKIFKFKNNLCMRRIIAITIAIKENVQLILAIFQIPSLKSKLMRNDNIMR